VKGMHACRHSAQFVHYSNYSTIVRPRNGNIVHGQQLVLDESFLNSMSAKSCS
jgi:hypothetical protein